MSACARMVVLALVVVMSAAMSAAISGADARTQASKQDAVQDDDASAEQPAQDHDARAEPVRDVAVLRAAWRDAIELDEPSEILESGAWIESDAQADHELTALYARALHAAGEDARALKLAARVDTAPLALAAARIAIDRDELDRARALLTKAESGREIPRFPDDPESWLLLGRAAARAGRLADAEPLLIEFVKRAPWHVEAPEAWFVLVEAARARNDAAEALRREASRSKSAEWHAFYRARRLQVRANPREPLPRLGLAQLWLAADEFERARTAIESAIAVDARFCRGIELAAEIERRLENTERARALCTQALSCDAKLVEVHLTLARIARDAGDTAASSASLTRYRELGGTKEL